MAQERRSLELAGIGPVPPPLVREARKRLQLALGWEVNQSKSIFDPSPAQDTVRRQYDAAKVIEILGMPAPGPGVKRIGLIPHDLFLPVFTHLFGYAELGGAAGVVSTFRIAPEPGAPAGLLLARTAKEILHELGHTLGLVHCVTPWCAMRPSRWPEEIDLRDESFCPPCARVL